MTTNAFKLQHPTSLCMERIIAKTMNSVFSGDTKSENHDIGFSEESDYGYEQL